MHIPDRRQYDVSSVCSMFQHVSFVIQISIIIADILTDVIIDCTYFLIIVFGVQRQFVDNLLDIRCQLCFPCDSSVVSKAVL